MLVDKNNTIVDLAFNLCGSLAGIPVILKQLPVGRRIGLAAMPTQEDEVSDIGQTWTPDVGGKDLTLGDLPLYNPEGKAKAPYSSNLTALVGAEEVGLTIIVETEGLWN